MGGTPNGKWTEMTDKERDIQDDMLRAQLWKTILENQKITMQNQWFLVIIASIATLAIIAFAKHFLWVSQCFTMEVLIAPRMHGNYGTSEQVTESLRFLRKPAS